MQISKIHEIISDAVNMKELVQELGIPYKIMGANMCILCTHHNDKSFGSCIVFDKNIFCFACNESINAIDLVMETNKCNFMDAVKFISDFYELHLDFKRDEESVNPLIISKKILATAGINDTAEFKKLYEQNPDDALKFLSCNIYQMYRKYNEALDMEMPDIAKNIIHQRIETLANAKDKMYSWRKDAGKPLRIK